MTFTNATILFFAALLPGIFLFLSKKQLKFSNLLVFSGAYLFTITITHLFPEVFHAHIGEQKIGYYVLVGFFLQFVIEYFTAGVEHGHLHLSSRKEGVISRPLVLALALSIHAFLEGTLLANPTLLESHKPGSLLLGIVFHKIPAAIALVSVLLSQLKSRKQVISFLLFFALASPAGLLLSDYFAALNLLSEDTFVILFAVVSGNFLHISTTIFFESTPGHVLNFRKIAIILIGVFTAIVAGFFL